MQEIIDFLHKEKEWLFSGAGIFLLTILTSYLKVFLDNVSENLHIENEDQRKETYFLSPNISNNTFKKNVTINISYGFSKEEFEKSLVLKNQEFENELKNKND